MRFYGRIKRPDGMRSQEMFYVEVNDLNHIVQGPDDALITYCANDGTNFRGVCMKQDIVFEYIEAEIMVDNIVTKVTIG